MTREELQDVIRRAGICLQCGQYGGGHSLTCPLHDESTCVVCREPVQIAVSFEYEPQGVA